MIRLSKGMSAMPIRVLLVEDTPIAQVVAKSQLIKQDCEVDIASDGIEALDKTSLHSYDLILMDIGLGEGPDGFEVTLQIKNNSPLNRLTPIVAVSSHNEEEYKEKAKAVGMAHYFNKPFRPADAKVIVDYIKERMIRDKKSM